MDVTSATTSMMVQAANRSHAVQGQVVRPQDDREPQVPSIPTPSAPTGGRGNLLDILA